ncbi:MAG: hypothetical protein RIR70_1444 [Pseudomonadota bacterium]
MTAHGNPTLQALQLEPLEGTASGEPLGAGVTDLAALDADLTVCVGRLRMSLADLLATRADQVIALDQLIDAPVDILAGQHVIARGELMAVEDHFAVRITEPPRHKATR